MSLKCKNYNKCGIFDLLCPHICRGCGRLGSVICECCKKNISKTKIDFKEGIACAWRDSLLGEMVEEYKYNSVRALGAELAEILDAKIPCLNGEVVVVPLPTIDRHIRERGLDHTFEIGKRLAKRRGWRCEKVLARKNKTVQVGASAKERMEQAKEAYVLDAEIENGVTYLLLDDVWTTGASMKAAEKLLLDAEASKVVKAVLVVSR